MKSLNVKVLGLETTYKSAKHGDKKRRPFSDEET